MMEQPRVVRLLFTVFGCLAFAPALVVVAFVVFRRDIPTRGLSVAVFATLMGVAFLWFWIRARTPLVRGVCVVLVAACALAASIPPDTLRGAYLIWLYPAAVIGFAFRPMRAVLTSVGLGVLILLLVVAGTPSAGEALRGALGTGVPALLTLGLGTWAAITINQLLVSNADLHAAREELARLAVEEERARFARDLHDLLGHTLSLIVVKLELTNRLLPQADSAAAAELRETEKLARDALRDVREVAGGYRQPTLASELAGAGVALEAAGIRMDLEKNVNVLPPEVEATVAWIVREGITNVVRHSQASVCSIRIRERKEGVMIEISDDGRGPTSSKPGIGLAGLRERVEARGGTLEWHGLEGGGFTVSASLPFTPDVAAR